MTEPRILALDLSLTRTGYCASGSAGPSSDVIRGDRHRGAERLSLLTKGVQALAAAADLVVLEGYSYASANGAHQLGELGGCVRLLLFRLGIPFVEVPPSTLKKWATGKGNAPKDAMIAEAVRRFGFAGSDNNEADAYLLWCMAREHYGAPVCVLPKVQREAAGKVVWPELA